MNNESEMKSKPLALVVDEVFIDFLALSCREAVMQVLFAHL